MVWKKAGRGPGLKATLICAGFQWADAPSPSGVFGLRFFGHAGTTGGWGGVRAHPSIEKIEGWGTHRFLAGSKGGPPATRRM
jgi:hypothetical protein